MRVLVLGGDGMLGHQVCRRLASRFEVWASYRGDPTRWTAYGNVEPRRAVGGVDASRFDTVESCVRAVAPAAVVNCIGIVKQRDEAKVAVPSILVNSLLPHLLAGLCRDIGGRLVHLSTDCVFSGRRGSYTEDDVPDPIDLYGRSKLLGEVVAPGSLTLRTSIVGWEVKGRASLLEWFASQRHRTIHGYQRVVYSGLSTAAMADTIAHVLEHHRDLTGLYQVASEPITKLDLLTRLRDTLGWKDIEIEPDVLVMSDRSLDFSRFAQAASWQPPGWEEMLRGLAEQRSTYEAWRKVT